MLDTNSLLVSIVIPSFNRANIIGETLDSIKKQEHKNWECIIIDDGSTDDTLKVIKKYHQKDSRFLFFERPTQKLKGANACRNIGLEKARGDYVVFFDSDDLMTPDHLKVKLEAISNSNCDFVITRTQYFNAPNDKIDKYYTFSNKDITAFNYIAQKINWLTLDTCIRAEIAKSIYFNENLKSGQEYNYFSKLTLNTVNAIFINKVVSLRRAHEASIRGQLKSYIEVIKSACITSWETYQDVKIYAPMEIKELLLFKCIHMMFKNNWFEIPNKRVFKRAVKEVYGFRGCLKFLCHVLFEKKLWERILF